MPRVTIFHTSDMHNKLTPRLADRLREIKSSHPNSLLLDSGDAIWSGNIYWRLGGEPILDLMNSVPYDAMCLGNREYHFLSAGLNSKTSRSQFPVLSANLRSDKNRTADAVKASVIFDVGVRVGVFGLSVPCITERMMVKKMADYYFVQPIDEAVEIAARLKKECDLLVALTHIGISSDREIAQASPNIDLILGGHTHTIENSRIDSTAILHSGMYAHYVRKVDIGIDAGEVEIESELISLGKA